jgi:triacylglycerol lipase
MFILIPALLLINLSVGFLRANLCTRQLKWCNHGLVLLRIFLASTVVSIAFHLGLLIYWDEIGHWHILASVLLCVVVEATVFWNGMICIFATSTQLGIRLRVVGALCGMIPIANLIVLGKMLRVVSLEIDFESQKEQYNRLRAEQQICKTRYPILLVHGVFFRDSSFFNYWGRIPKELEKNGAVVYYGEQHSAASVASCGEELRDRILAIVEDTRCEKVNIIAHSKGGLDSRFAISMLDAAPYVASLTTINTPHRGCEFADFLLTNAPDGLKEDVAITYNAALRKLGEPDADFMSAVTDLTASACTKRDRDMGQPDGIFCQSVGSVLRKASGGTFPLNLSYHLVKYFDGPNDGLVGEKSFRWGENYTLLEIKEQRGISHADMIDLNRENISGFDVREFYVQLVHDLKMRGL